MLKTAEVTTSIQTVTALPDREPLTAVCSGSAAQRIVVIGSGPVGMRFVQEVCKRLPRARIQLFGNEPFQPYNRVQLSALLAGEVGREDIDIPLPSSDLFPHFEFSIAAIRSIDVAAKTVTDAYGRVHGYDKLVIATGARAHVPNIPGVDQTGVYTFRNLKDTESLYTRVARSRHAVVVGGGLLGLEAARGLQQFGTGVTLVQQGPRLMNRQLDTRAGALLLEKVEALGIRVITDSGVREIFGQGRVTGVKTRAGESIDCDTVLLCAGIRPNVELALAARLVVATGIVVNNQLQTSHPDIYAIGECCEHQGKTYGLVNPGFEQAAVAATVLTGGEANYLGSQAVSRLKVVGQQVCSMGEVAELPVRRFQRELAHEDRGQDAYRKLVLLRNRVVGAVAFGEWPEMNRVQEAFQSGRRLYFWQRLLFRLTGRLWSNKDASSIAQWPGNAIVCQCNGISKGALIAAADAGATRVSELQSCTGAGTVCGSCRPLLSQLVSYQEPAQKEIGWTFALSACLAALSLVLLLVLMPEAQVASSVQADTWFESFWNDKYRKQVTGFSLLGLSVIGMLMSLRKRVRWAWLGQFAYWRLLHIGLGVVCALLLVFHTGFHLGSNLNHLLMLNFLAVLVLGASAGGIVALSHKLKPSNSRMVRKLTTWLHILVTWPLPALLAIHILSVYYF